MKLRTLLPSIIFLMGALSARAQITQVYYQGFETGDNVTYRADQPACINYSSTIFMGGARALKLDQSTSGDVTFTLDTLDFTQDNALRYISLEFDHICAVRENSSSDFYVGRIYYKRANQNDNQWTQLTSQHYNTTDRNASSEFQMTGTFNRNSYNNWLDSNPDNEDWVYERFDLNNALPPGLPTNERKLILKFVLRAKTHSQSIGSWYIDNIKINASPSLMIKPTITMFKYPEALNYPSSRGAKIVLDAATSVTEGINPDSVYLYYRIGSNPAHHRLSMTPVSGVTNRYTAHIPFAGYDTSMYFYCVVRDASTNANQITFPAADNAWVEYRCIRGAAQPGIATDGFAGTSTFNFIPFPARADHKSEWVYDSALLAQAGYLPGSITSFTYTLGANVNANLTRPGFLIKMKNVPTNYTVDLSAATIPFTSSYMQTVYDGAYTINAATLGSTQTVQLQDTFRYAGQDILMQISYNDVVDGTSTTIRMIPTAANKTTIWYNGGEAIEGINGRTIPNAFNTETRRPAFVFTQQENLPLLYDLGISELVNPSYETPMVNRPGSITVRLKNFGALTANAIRISYSIDNGAITGHHDWSGTLNANQTTDVTIANNNISLDAGFHTLRVWVEDTLRAGTNQFRDHEPYNDTAFSQFVVCDGPMNGQRNIGGTNADFNNIEEFLYALGRCGIDDSLIVNLAPGSYPGFTIPQVNGLSESHYIVFRPAGGNVTLYADSTQRVSSIVNLEQVANIRFRDINFVRRNGMLTDMITMGDNSNNCHFERCTFTDSVNVLVTAMRISNLINNGAADGMVVDGCTFTGGFIGVAIHGIASDILSQNNTVRNSVFYNQNNNAISVQNQVNPVVEKNELYDVTTNTSYVLLVFECSGTTRIVSNKIYTSHGAGALGVSNVTGTSTTPALIANNMIVNNDDGNANQMTAPLNVIQATWTDVVYNSVKMTANNRSNAAAVVFGGGILNNSRFMNNVVVALDNNNYALNYQPLGSTTNTLGHNVYFANSGTLCRMMGQAHSSIASWRTALPSDSTSISTNPNFLNGSLVDLRTYNRLVKGVGLPMASVPTDMFDSVRSTTATCPGAFEFVSLGYDFEPEALTSPELETCYMPSSVELAVRLRNSGVNAYTTTGLNLSYKVNNGPVNTVAITNTVPAEDTVTIYTGRMLNLPPNGKLDATYTITVWTSFANDPNSTNDTNVFTVVSKYHPTTPTDINLTPDYATALTVTPTAGIESWAVYGNTTAPQRKSTLYWYRDSTDAAPFHVGPTLTTDTLRTDTVFYIQQRRNMPIVRITQLEISRGNNAVGLTPNMPYWMVNNRKAALQLTNIGDATAYLEGDTLMTVSDENNLNNKVYTFGDVRIEPGQSLVVQVVAGNSSNPEATVLAGNLFGSTNLAWNKKIAFVYRSGGRIEDLVAVNTTSTTANWSALGQPSYIWNGPGVAISNNTISGIVRTTFNGTAADWRQASNALPMFLGTTDPAWVRYTDNGCEGRFGTVSVTLANAPINDLHLDMPILPEPQCGMGEEDITVTVHNYGIMPVNALTLNYCAGGDTVSETITTGIPANGVITHTFAQQLNLAFDRDSVVTVRVWADALPDDQMHGNDTAVATTLSLFTPNAPATLPDRVVYYSDRDTITLVGSALVLPNLVPTWYNYDMEVVDTGYTHITDRLYTSGMMGMAYIATKHRDGRIGTASDPSGDADPNPYTTKNKFARQQYIYSASELRAAGLEAGLVEAIHFYLHTLTGASQTLYDYTIGLGLTSDTIFSNGNNDWRETQTVYSTPALTLTSDQAGGWVRHGFSTPYEWDGESSLVVEVSYNLPAAINNGTKTHYSTKPNSAYFKLQNSAITTGSRTPKRPNIMFDTLTYGCEGPMTTFNVTMTNIPPVDMALYWPNHVDTIHYNSCDSIPIYINARNQGSTDRNGATIYYYLDSNPVDSLVITSTIAAGQLSNQMLFKKEIGPGRHKVKAIVHVPGDMTSSNDTIERTFIVHFCRGTYTIAQTDGDFASFGEAIDSLNVAGIEGPVVFQVEDGTYTEQVVLNNVQGSNDTNTISFVGTGNDVLLTAATTQNANYVMQLDSASNVILSNFRIEARPTATGAAGNHAYALVVGNGQNITIDSMTFRVKGSLYAATASCILLNSDLTNLNITNSVIDSGYYSIKSAGTGYNNLNISHNKIRNFQSQGVNLRNVTDLSIKANRITTGATANNRDMTGLYLAQSSGTIEVSKNHIYMLDNFSGYKRGIQLHGIATTTTNQGLVANNMIGTNSTFANNKISAGIWIDSSSSNLSILFNTVRVNNNATGTTSDKSYGLFTSATVSGIQVMNNLLSNFGLGYAYYVSELNTVTLSNYNGYYTTGNRPFRWKNDIASLSALQTASGGDGNSVVDEPYFRDDDDLHLLMTNFVAKAQPNDRVTEDIDGKMRPIIPVPTIGAHEMEIKTHDMAVVRITSPTMPANINAFSATNMPPNVESDDVTVTAQFYNNGQSTENNVQWYAYIEGHEAETTTPMQSLGTVQPGQMKTATVAMPTVLGIVDTARVHVVVVIPVDSVEDNNNVGKNFYLAPAYNFEATQVTVSATTPSNCYRHNTTVSIKLTNKGFKTIPEGTSVNINYLATLNTPNVTVSTLPASASETITLEQDLYIGNNTVVDFATPANLYPTGNYTDISVALRAWCSNALDVVPTNDTTPSLTVQSYYTPAAPIGYDTTINYGTWGALRASQENGLAIRWYRDSTATPFYQPSNYAASCLWNNTPQYFDDSVYYLTCRTNRQCQSPFSEVWVHLDRSELNDIAFEQVLAPLGSRVYMENDTVRVKISNYGSNTQSNIPITYQLKRGNNVIQEVTEVCPATLTSTQSTVYTFNELLNIPTPTQQQNYSLTIWTDLPTDGVRRNDTIRTPYTFRSLPEGNYDATKSDNPTFDITRVSYDEIDIDLPAMGRARTILGTYNNPEYPVLHTTRGAGDTLIVGISSLDPTAQNFRYRTWAMIDFDRSGTFSTDEVVVNGELLWSNELLKSYVAIPESASYGYMRMRIVAASNTDYDGTSVPTSGIASGKDGHVMDFLLFVNETVSETDLAITQILSPRDYLIRNDRPVSISFRIVNKGSSPLTSPEISYSFAGDTVDTTATGSVRFAGTLQPGRSGDLTLPAHHFPLGTSTLTLWHNTNGDTLRANDTLRHEYHRFHTVELTVDDNFDFENIWYAPTGYNNFSRNYWQRGIPNKIRLNAANSEPNAWVTDLNASIASGRRGNASYLYSPIIDISQVRPDTISFYLRRNLTGASSLHLEFLNFENRWVKADHDSATNWYTDSENRVFNGSTPTNAPQPYTRYWLSSSTISGDFQEKLQFRFVYSTPISESANASFGEGCAIDDFRLGRAPRAEDVGVIEIVEPTITQYGRTYYPRVVVKNFGLDTARTFSLGYTTYGSFLSRECAVTCNIAPGATDTLTHTAPFVVTSDFPEEFDLTVFTQWSLDIYRDNDTITKHFALSPLDDDISAHELLYPLDKVIAGDTSLEVTLRIRNFGNNPISHATASYLVNDDNRVDETIDFNDYLGRPLEPLEYFNYTFRQKLFAPMGLMKITAFIKSEQNEYIYNDTVVKRVRGISSVLDLAAAAVIVDTSDFNNVLIQLKIENRGSLGVNGFEVGFILDDDTNTKVTETYSRENPIPGLSTAYHMFNVHLPQRAMGYPNVKGFVHVSGGDNDPSNDSTKTLETLYTDLEATMIQVEETGGPTCKVRLQVTNVGNLTIVNRTIDPKVTVNGTAVGQSVTRYLRPGDTTHIEFPLRVAKSPTRTYNGEADIRFADKNLANNKTTRLQVLNHFEGVPVVLENQLELEQNYPNPFTGQTTIPFVLPNAAKVRFFIIDALGHMVNSFEQHFDAGRQTLTLDMSQYSTGVYFYGIEVDGQRRMKKMIMR